MPKSGDQPALRPIHFILLGAIFAGGTLLRVHAVGRTSFWNDEICSVLYERGQTSAIFDCPRGYFGQAPAIASRPGTRPLADVWSHFDSNPPLYATVLRGWWNIFGDTDVSARSLSIVCSLATLLVVFDAGRLIGGPSVGLWASALCAASPPMVNYAQEARPYALVGLLGILACDVALRISMLGGNALRYALLGLFCISALLTHFFIIGAVSAIGLYALLAMRGNRRIVVVCIIALALTVEIWAVPIMAHTVALQGAHGGLNWLNEPRAGLIGRTFVRLAVIPATLLIQPMGDPSLLSAPSIAVVLLPIFLCGRRPGLLLTGLWPAAIIGLVAFNDLWRSQNALCYIRYTLAAAPMIFIALANLADMGGRWTRHVLPTFALLGALLAVSDVYTNQIWQKTESRLLAQDLMAHFQPGDVVVVGSQPDMGFYSASMEYLALDFYCGPLHGAAAILEEPADETARKAIWSHPRVWLVETFHGFNVAKYLGPCRAEPVADTRYQSGRLYLAHPLP